MHTGSTPLVKWINSTEKTQKGGTVKFEISVANPIEKLDFDQHMILRDVPCDHFAFDTLSQTCLKDAVFDINVRQHKLTRISKIPKC